MKTNKEIITEIIENLNLVKLNKNNKVTKEKLIKCWSEYRIEPDYKFYGYISSASLCKIYKRLFKNIEGKVSKETWKTYILRLYNYKYCYKCKNLTLISNFHKANTASRTSGQCKKCSCLATKSYKENNNLQEYYKEYYKDYYIENKEKHLINSKKYREAHKEKIAEYKINWCLKNPDIVTASKAKYRASKLQRTPDWLTEEDHWMFKEIYSLAKQREELTGIKWHVDHIIPLQGELVCGLHVPINLQVITATENLQKSNKFNT